MRRSNAAVVKIRVGLNSGEVVVRAIGSDLHMDYTAGKRQEAHEHLTTAATMYREMDMRFWLEQAETEAQASELT